MMSKEAMNLAKAWFERNTYGDEAVDVYDALCEALAKQPAQQALDKMAENARELGLDYEPAQQKESMRPYRLLQDNGSKYFGESWDKAEQPAQQALDKMAENARELGLDYEPVWGSGPTNKDYEDAMRQKRLHQLTSPQPAQRTWVGLTDEEADELVHRFARYELLRAIEAKLKEKNT